jgi:cytochrome o ubiquinol oxidase subunit III
MSMEDLRHPGLNLGITDPEAHIAAEELVFGFWVFLMSDLILFALLFATYASMIGATAGGPGAKDLFDIKSAAIETGVLLTSSFTFGMASLAMKYVVHPRSLLFWLIVTLLLGFCFLGLEVRDFLTLFAKGAGPTRSGFLSAFFVLVPTHGLHVFAGSIWMIVMIVQIMIFGIDQGVKIRILRLGLFWHFLDIIWIGIFSVVYLQGLA